MIDELLDLAEELAERDEAIAKRKAISMAYYAAFHALCELVADALVEDKESPLYSKIYRHIEHGIIDKSGAFSLDDKPYETMNEVRDQLRNLRQRRETSDYSPFVQSEILDAQDAITRGHIVVRLIRSIGLENRRELALNIILGNSKKSRGSGPSETRIQNEK
ncbi:MAG: HEPN domain-containing protein [Pseudomonadota bacterium]